MNTNYLKFSPTKQRANKKRIFGFDIETYDCNKGFLCSSIYGDEDIWFFRDKDLFLRFLKNKEIFGNTFIVASNLSFDFMGTFFGKEEIMEFNTLFRGSDLICASTFVEDGKLYRQAKKREGKDKKMRRVSRQNKLTFIDTFNFAKISVEKLGNIIGIKKLGKPDFLGEVPKDDTEWEIITEYNIRDSEVSKRYMDFLFDSFYKLGASPKMTIASTAKSLFQNVYLKDSFFPHPKEILIEQFKGYYGGRTEAIARGGFGEKWDTLRTGQELSWVYYDLNSLYPFCMTKELPDPNTLRTTYKNTLEYIRNYEGMSDVSLSCPYMKFPLIPFRTKDKLLFPTGSFRGSYCHNELRKALILGYTITRVHRTYYYKKTIPIFRNYALDLYNKRLAYKAEGSSMEYVVKLLLNSLYGKFSEKIDNRDNWIPSSATMEELLRYDEFDRIGSFFRVIVREGKPHAYSFPIWSSYITSIARMILHEAMVRYDPIYVDTDSIMTTKKVDTGKGLGEWKKEMDIREGVIVRPKFYALKDRFPKKKEKEEVVKVKGLGTRLSYLEFMGLCVADEKKVYYDKFIRFKEALRHDFIPNEIRETFKTFDIDDKKRVWDAPFDIHRLNFSSPHNLIDGEMQVYEEPISMSYEGKEGRKHIIRLG